MSTAKKLLSINLITSISLAIGLISNSVIAYFFGLTPILDAYFTALVVPSMFMGLFLDFVGKNFLPIFSECKKRGTDDASRLASTVVNVVVLLSILIVGILLAVSQPLFDLIVPGFSEEQALAVNNMFLIMAPSIILMGINMFHSYIWQYHEHYLRPVLASAILPLPILLSVVMFHDTYAEFSLAIGFLVGQVMRCLIVTIGVGYQYHFRIFDLKGDGRRIVKSSGILTVSGLLSRMKPILERYYGSMLDAGSISALAFADKVCNPIAKTSTIGVKMMAFSKASRLHAKGQLQAFGELYTKTIIAVFMFIIPVVVWAALSSETIISLLFTRGNFDQSMQITVSLAFIGLLPSIIFVSVNRILSNGFYVLDRIMVPALAGPVAIIIYLGGLMVVVERYEILGLALARTLLTGFRFFVQVYFLSRFLNSFTAKSVLAKLVVYLVIAMFSFLAANELAIVAELGSMGQSILTGFVGILFYFATLYVFKDSGFSYVRAVIFRR